MIEIYLPQTSRPEHLELHDQLSKARRVGGRTAQSADAVMAVLYPHIVLEEKYAVPPLALLPRLAAGEVTEDMRPVVKAAERLKRELSSMLEDHGRIVKALKDFMQASAEEGHGGYAQFAQKLIHHAPTGRGNSLSGRDSRRRVHQVAPREGLSVGRKVPNGVRNFAEISPSGSVRRSDSTRARR